jgi:hypothetical protein
MGVTATRSTTGTAPGVDTSAAVLAVDDLWSRLVGLGERIGTADWGRPTPCRGTDVRGLIDHLVGAAGAVGSSPRDQLLAAGSAQRRVLGRLLERADDPAAAPPARLQRVLGATCLDLWVHAVDLARGLGEPVDEDAPGLDAACSYALGLAPLLVARGAGHDGAALRILIDGEVPHDAVLRADGRGRWDDTATTVPNVVRVTAAGLVLLLSGRIDPATLRDTGALAWEGAQAEAFVRDTRLPG